MHKHAIFGLALCMVTTAYSQSIKVSGTVNDAAGKPIADAIVELLREQQKDTTGADGTYSLNVVTNALGRSAVTVSEEVSLRKGILGIL